MSTTKRFSVCMVAAVVVVFVGLAKVSSQGAQPPRPSRTQPPQASDTCPDTTAAAFHACAIERAKMFDPARTADGKPDMQGFWQSPFGGTQNIEEHARNAVAPAGKTLIVDPPDGLIPYQPWAAAQIKENAKKYVEPNAACFPSGAPRSFYTPGGFQIRQSPGYVVVLFDRAHNYRIIPTDGRPHLGGNILLWQGDPRGRWEGNTLVVDIINQNGKSWLDQQGRFNTDALHVVERFTFVDADTMLYEARIDDPSVYAKPWTMAFPMRRDVRREATAFVEEDCYEGDETAQMLLGLGYRIFPGIRLRSGR